MAEYSRIAKGHFTSTGAAKAVNLPFQPDAVEMWNYTAAATPAQNGVPYAYWDVSMGQGYALANYFNATPVLSSGAVILNGISSFSAGLQFQFGAQQQIIGATAANPAVFNVTAHGYAVGDVVVFQGLYQAKYTTGMAQMGDMPFVISAVGDADHFSVVWPANQSEYTALSGSPAGAYVKKVLYPFMYEPGVAYIEAISTGSSTTVTTTAPHNFVVGQEIAFRIPAAWGMIQLNSLPNSVTPGSPIYAYVTSVTSNTVFVCNFNSVGFTAFNTNQTIASVPGLQLPQVVAVGDVNSGGVLISAGSPLYPSPEFPTSSNRIPSINGPAIRGAFVNNTSQGFIIGAGSLVGLSSTHLVGASDDVIYWRAYLSDLSV